MVIRGSGDPGAPGLAAPPSAPLCALARGPETVIEHAATSEPLAWFPLSLEKITTHPSRPAWAGADASYLCIIQLEGDPS